MTPALPPMAAVEAAIDAMIPTKAELREFVAEMEARARGAAGGEPDGPLLTLSDDANEICFVAFSPYDLVDRGPLVIRARTNRVRRRQFARRWREQMEVTAVSVLVDSGAFLTARRPFPWERRVLDALGHPAEMVFAYRRDGDGLRCAVLGPLPPETLEAFEPPRLLFVVNPVISGLHAGARANVNGVDPTDAAFAEFRREEARLDWSNDPVTVGKG